jgi:hypothetical protein
MDMRNSSSRIKSPPHRVQVPTPRSKPCHRRSSAVSLSGCCGLLSFIVIIAMSLPPTMNCYPCLYTCIKPGYINDLANTPGLRQFTPGFCEQAVLEALGIYPRLPPAPVNQFFREHGPRPIINHNVKARYSKLGRSLACWFDFATNPH